MNCDRCQGTGWWMPPNGNPEPCCERPADAPDCTEPNRAACPRLCVDFCNKVESERERMPALRRLTLDEVCEVAPDTMMSQAERIQRKFCEINGLPVIPQKSRRD